MAYDDLRDFIKTLEKNNELSASKPRSIASLKSLRSPIAYQKPTVQRSCLRMFVAIASQS